MEFAQLSCLWFPAHPGVLVTDALYTQILIIQELLTQVAGLANSGCLPCLRLGAGRG